MAVMVACAVLLVFGLVVTIRWSALPIAAPPREQDGSAGTAALRSVWWLGLAAAAGASAGLLVLGPGGRLAMRLLAVTAGDDAQGALTEADEIVGDITLGGTLGFMIFVGLLGGAFTGLVYVAIQRWLPGPPGRGLAFGAVLLVLFATRIEPLRTSNEDFDLVGPTWVTLLVFAALAFAQGAAVSAFVNRWSRTQPMLTSWRAIPRYLPLLPFLLAGTFALVILLIAALNVLIVRLTRSRAITDKRVMLTGRIVLILVLLVALPGSIAAFADIAGRGP
jgi:hypothetical protein